jgi:hypothetical protein
VTGRLPDGERQRWLAEHWGDHHVVDHHPQGEAAAEAHAHCTDAGTAHRFVEVGRKRRRREVV